MTTPEQEAAPERTEEQWTCVGARVGSTGKRVEGWMNREGTVTYLLARSSHAIGGQYRFEIEHADGERTGIYGPLSYAGRETDPELLQAWRAEEVAAETHFARKAAERKAKDTDPLDELLDPLVKIARRLKNGPARDAFTAHIIRRVSRAAGW